MSIDPSVVINSAPPVPGGLLSQLAELELPAFGHILDAGFASGLTQLAGGPGLRAGRVITVRLADTDSRILHYATTLIEPGDFVVVDAGRWGDYAAVGGGIAAGLAVAGATGIATSGACTDLAELEGSGLIVYGRGPAAFTTRANGRAIKGSINEAVSLGGVTVTPGMVAMADGNGLLLAPASTLAPLLDRVRELMEWEPPVMAQVRAGARIGELTLAPDDLAALNVIAGRKATA
jgi:4-hydroxy-4-methyl-2-oxoglutarate aldolase